MNRNKWFVRIISSMVVALIILLFSLFKEGNSLLNLINLTFLTGIFLIIISGTYFVISSGFFDTFIKTMKMLFRNDDPYTDKTHWSFERDEEAIVNRKLLTREYVLLIPLTTASFLIILSLFLLIFFYSS